MIFTLIIWAYLAFITLAWGIGFMGFLRRLLGIREETIFPFSVLVVTGLNVTAWLSSILSIFMKMSWLAHSLIVLGAIFLAWRYAGEIKTAIKRDFGQKHWVYWILLTLGGLVVLLYAVKVPTNPDTPLYHAQAIRWIEEFPAVPGLANLDVRFGSNSNWFTVNALFSLSFLGAQSFHLVPSLLFLAIYLYFLGGIQNILVGEVRIGNVLRAGMIPVSFYVLIDEISSPGTDLPVILSYWLILCLWIELMERNNESSLWRLVVFVLSIMMITYKVSGALILLIGLLILAGFLRRKEYRLFWLSVVIAGACTMPWMARNFVLTGYWLYPQPGMEIFSPPVDWRVPAETVLSFKHGVQAWAIAPRTKWDEIAGLSFSGRYALWFADLTLNRKGIFVLALVSPILFFCISILLRLTKKDRMDPSFWLVLFVGYSNLLFWLLSAPNFRFGYGFMLGLIVLVVAFALRFLYMHWSTSRSFLTSALVVFLCLQQIYVMVGAWRDDTSYKKYLVYPAPYAQVASSPCTVGDLTINCAKSWRQCGYDAFPCLAQPAENVELRGDTLRTGFRRTIPNHGN